MGIKNLNKLIKEHAPTSIRSRPLTGGYLIIDTSYIIYKYACAIGKSGGITYKDRNVSHVYGIFRFIQNLLKNKITPVFVFDGGVPEEKKETLEKRVKGDFSIKDSDTDDVKKMLKFLGIQYLDAPEEADAQCAYFAKKKGAIGVYSRDTDMLMFGAPKLITDIDFKKKTHTYVSLILVLKNFDLTYNKFVDLCILLGCDYCPSPHGVGYKTAFKTVRTKKIDDIIPQKDRVKFTRAYVYQPKIKRVKLREYSSPRKPKEIANFMHKHFGFNKENIAKILK